MRSSPNEDTNTTTSTDTELNPSLCRAFFLTSLPVCPPVPPCLSLCLLLMCLSVLLSLRNHSVRLCVSPFLSSSLFVSTVVLSAFACVFVMRSCLLPHSIALYPAVSPHVTSYAFLPLPGFFCLIYLANDGRQIHLQFKQLLRVHGGAAHTDSPNVPSHARSDIAKQLQHKPKALNPKS